MDGALQLLAFGSDPKATQSNSGQTAQHPAQVAITSSKGLRVDDFDVEMVDRGGNARRYEETYGREIQEFV